MSKWQKPIAMYGVLLMVAMCLNSQTSLAQEHVVSLKDIQKQLELKAESVAKDRSDIERVLSLPASREMLRKSNIGAEQVRTAVAMLSPAELSRLAVRAREAEQDVQGGLLVGILALIGLVVVILVVIAIVNDDEVTVP